jgi:hypothetical protein
MTPRHQNPWRGRLLRLALGLLLVVLLVGRAAASSDGQPPSPLACPAGAVTWLTGTAPPGSALLVRFADATVGGGSAGSDTRWRIPLTVAAPAGVYPVVVVERQSRSLIAAFTCYVGVPIGATSTGTPTLQPTNQPGTTRPSATATPHLSSTFPTPSTTALGATTDAPTALSLSATPSMPPPTTIVATATATSTALPAGETPVTLVTAQADDPNDSVLFEYVVLENQSAQPQALLGWRLAHQATGEAYSFSDISLLPGEQLVVWSGGGEDDPDTGTLFWPSEGGRYRPGQTIELRAPDDLAVSTLVVPELNDLELSHKTEGNA